MDRIMQMIDDLPLLKLFTQIVTEGPGMLAGKIGGALSKIGNAMGDAMENVGGGALGDWMKGGGNDRAVAVAEPSRSPSKEITAPAQSLGSHDVDPAQLGNFSSQSFSTIAPTKSQGVAV